MLEHYNPILTAIKKLCPSAHIGGGAVRDSLLERPIQDIDLFLDDAATGEAAKLLRSEFRYVKVGEWENYAMFSDPAVAHLAKFEKADEIIPVCLIGLMEVRDMKANLRRFDFGICMAAWGGGENTQLSSWAGGGEVIYTALEYKRDVENKTFTLCRADDLPQFTYSMSRFHKMTKDRYAGWKLVVPAEFKELEQEYTQRKDWYRDLDAGKCDRAVIATAGPVFDLEPSMRFHLINDGGLVRLDELETMERNRSPLDPPLHGSAALWDNNTAGRVLVNLSRDGLALFDTKTKISHRMKLVAPVDLKTLSAMLRNLKETVK